jgi:hypothetical protein
LKSCLGRRLSPMENDIKILRSLFRSETDYHRVEQWWARFWAEIPNSASWVSPWLNTRLPIDLIEGDGILNAKNEQLGRAFKIIHEKPEPGGLLVWWKQIWDPDYDNLIMLVLVIVPSAESIEATKSLLSAWAKGDDVDDKGDLRWR